MGTPYTFWMLRATIASDTAWAASWRRRTSSGVATPGKWMAPTSSKARRHSSTLPSLRSKRGMSNGRGMGLQEPELPVRRLGVVVLELQNVQTGERLAHFRGEQAEPLQVGDDPHEEGLAEHLGRGGGEHHLADLVPVPAHGLGELVAHEPVSHQLAGVDDEVLPVAELVRGHVVVVVPQRE